MVDFATTQAQVDEVAPLASHEGDHAEAVVAKLLIASPPLTADGVDKLHRQLEEIHAIAIVQLAECAH
jgi:hypothetical protein